MTDSAPPSRKKRYRFNALSVLGIFLCVGAFVLSLVGLFPEESLRWMRAPQEYRKNRRHRIEVERVRAEHTAKLGKCRSKWRTKGDYVYYYSLECHKCVCGGRYLVHVNDGSVSRLERMDMPMSPRAAEICRESIGTIERHFLSIERAIDHHPLRLEFQCHPWYGYPMSIYDQGVPAYHSYRVEQIDVQYPYEYRI